MSFEHDGGPEYWTDEYVDMLAERKGCTVERADSRTLQLDIDSQEAYDVYVAQLALLESVGVARVAEVTERPSKSGLPKRHVVITLTNELDVPQRIALQAALGSDRKRELLSYAGWQHGMAHPIVLFRPKGE